MHSKELHKKDLLRKFIDRSITPKERHELEELALDDPFLFEALEGYALGGSQNTNKEINSTVAKIVKQEKKKRNTGFRFSQIASIAAGLLFVAVMGFVIRQSILDQGKNTIQFVDKVDQTEEASEDQLAELMKERDESAVIKQEEVEEKIKTTNSTSEHVEKDIEFSSTSSTSDLDAGLANTNEIIPVKREDPKVQEVPTVSSREVPNTSIAVDGVAMKESSVKQEQEIEDVATASPPAVEETMPQSQVDNVWVKKKQASKMQLEEKSNIEFESAADLAAEDVEQNKTGSKRSKAADEQRQNVRTVKGQVFDSQGVPLIGANVIESGSSNGTTTDIDGEFALMLSKDASQLSISYTGFTEQVLVLGESNEYQVTLEEGALLDEIVISKMANIVAEPLVGFDQFEEYLKENLALEDCSRSRTLIFEVDASGALKKIRSENGTYDACTNEAIRLLKNSGNWKSIPPKRTVTTQYTFDFRR